ncbi:MAG: peptidase S41, partial [Alteromonadaceae bacterium]|nr:peptidase S41 [Alteromonadaceae bacterium]
LEVFADRVCLKNEYRYNDTTLPKGSRLVSINNIAIEDIFSHAQQFVGGETEILRQHTVAARFPIMLWAVFGLKEQFRLVVSVEGEEQLVYINGGQNWQPVNPLPDAANDDFVYYRLNNHTGYLKVATFDVSPDWFESFIDDTFRTINQQNVHNLIIDIRDNTGGNTDTATYLARHLALAPFRMISSLQERLNTDNRGLFNYRGNKGDVLKEEWNEWQTPIDSAQRFNGNAYVLISPVSYSSAIVFATAVQDNAMATLVGRETGGYANQTAQGNLFNLPNSELRAYVATRLLVRPSGDLRVRGVVPDITVTATTGQIQAGEDADMLAALEHAELLQR